MFILSPCLCPRSYPLSHWHWVGPWICFGWWDSTNMMQRLERKLVQQSHPCFCYSGILVTTLCKQYAACFIMRNTWPKILATSQAIHSRETIHTSCPHSCMSGISIPMPQSVNDYYSFMRIKCSRFCWLYLFDLKLKLLYQ